jgi:hypothetical protein
MPSNIELYLNGELMDLSDGTVIALTKQTNDIGDITSFYGDFSNEFALPFTARNKLLLEMSNIVSSSSNLPYTKMDAKYVDNGVEIVPNGYALIRYSLEGYMVTIYSNNSNLFSRITGKFIKDIDWFDLNHYWTIENIKNSRLNDDGLLYPVISYGADYFQDSLEQEGFYPSLYGKTIVERIISEAGFSFDLGVLEDNTKYQKLLFPWCIKEWVFTRQDYLYFDKGDVTSSLDITISYDWETFTIVGSIVVTFVFLDQNGDIDLNLSGMYVDLAQDYIFNNTTGSATVTASYSGVPFLNGSQRRISAIFIPTGVGGGAMNITVTNMEITINSTNDDTAEVYLDIIDHEAPHPIGNQLISFNGASDEYFTVYHEPRYPTYFDHDNNIFGQAFTYVEISKPVPLTRGKRVLIKDQLPDILQTDFLKAVFLVFGIIPDTVDYNQTVYSRSYIDLINNLVNRKDWSSKYCEPIGYEQLDYHNDNYGKVNKFTWEHDDIGRFTLDGSFTINDDSLEPERKIISHPFSSSLHIPILTDIELNLETAILDKFSDADNLKEITPRFVVLNRVDLSTPVNYTGDSISSEDESIPLVNFYRVGSELNLDWNTLITDHY